MIISRRKQPSLPSMLLTVNDSPLARVTSYKYLGVWLTPTLNWSMQVANVCKKARQQIGIIYRRFYQHSNTSTLLQLYLACVPPHLEYAAPLWDPHQQCHINTLERVQKFAIKVCTKGWNTDYGDLLNSCNLTTLTSRRHYLKLCFLYQIINGNFIFPNAPIVRRSTPAWNLRNYTPSLLHRPAADTNAYHYSFFPHTIALWNTFPSSAHTSDTLRSFKHATSHLSL